MKGNTQRFWKRAREMSRDPKQVGDFLRDAEGHIHRNRHYIQNLWHSVKLLIRLVKAWWSGEYRDVPWRTILSALFALIYLFDPIDLIPDFLIGGFIDDALVVGWVVASIRTDLERFSEWERDFK